MYDWFWIIFFGFAIYSSYKGLLREKEYDRQAEIRDANDRFFDEY